MPDDAIRNEYERVGVERFYAEHGGDYRNPHEPQVATLIRDLVNAHSLDVSTVLDLAAGSGEATLALLAAGAKHVDAIDPFTAEAYTRRTGRPCEPLTFADLAAGAIANRRYSLIVCSFALHLCEPSRLPQLLWQLAEISPRLMILTPHKRPTIEAEWRWRLIEERIVDRVRGRVYSSE